MVSDELSTNEATRGNDFGRFVGTAPAMRRLYREIEQVAASNERVLIEGKTGTGKKLVAAEIRDRSVRRARPFVVLNCAGYDHSLIERELFGHVKGSFTGATESKKGLFEAADGGILLLDEAGSMPAQLQGRLLEVLESGRVRRIGSTATLRVDVRVLAATNNDLWQRTQAGEFREDLFWRLAVGIIRVPPLRERREDIPRLLEYFARQCYSASSSGGAAPCLWFSPGAIDVLIASDWPGNVRQLEHLVRRINMRHTDRARPVGRRVVEQEMEYISDVTGGGRPRAGHLRTLREVEEEEIRRALKLTGGNTQRASTLLGIGRSTIYRKLRTYNIRSSDFLPPLVEPDHTGLVVHKVHKGA